MLLVVDTNIIVSSLIKESTTREIILSTDIEFVTPEWVHSEIQKHSALIAKKARVSNDELVRFTKEVFQVVRTVPRDQYQGYLDEAIRLMTNVDKDDAPFIALALYINADAVWTNDKHLKKQDRVPVISTKDIMKHIGLI
jgi:predicted nucleic acid-binding protein